MELDYAKILQKRLLALEKKMEEESHGLLHHNITSNKKLAQLWHKIEKPGRQKNLETIREIKAALKRIEIGTYGKCSACGKEFSKQELLLRPERELCQECKLKQKKDG